MLESSRFRAPDSATLARRLHLLLDYTEVLRGDPYTYPEISAFLENKGVSLSRSRWSYMLSGEHWRIRDSALLDALAELFEVTPEFFYGEGEMPLEMEAELRLVLSMRAARIQQFAARNLKDLAPEVLDEITKSLEQIVPAGRPEDRA